MVFFMKNGGYTNKTMQETYCDTGKHGYDYTAGRKSGNEELMMYLITLNDRFIKLHK